MADITAILEPLPSGVIADFTGTIDPFVAGREYELSSVKVAFTPTLPVTTPDTTPPEVTNFVPTGGTSIGRQDQVQFDVTDDSGNFRRIIVGVRYDNIRTEFVHDGDSFTAPYLASTRVTITNGFRYIVRRTGGWLSDPNIVTFAIDPSGNEA